MIATYLHRVGGAMTLAGFLLAGSTAQAQDSVARERPPAPGQPRDLRLPPVRTFSLKNGLKVSMVSFGRVPKVAVRVVLATGVIDEGPTDAGLARVVADGLLEGTTTKAGAAIARSAADMGGSVSSSRAPESMEVGGDVLTEFGPAFVALLADVVRNPRFAEPDIKRVIDRRVRDTEMALSQPGALAQKRFYEVSYGDHPFARVYPSESTLRAFTVDRVRAFHTANFGATRAHVYVSGVFNAAAMERAIRQAFDDWASGAAATNNPPTVAARRQIDVVDRPNSVQSSIIMGGPAPHPADPDWARMSVTDALLGGTFGSRITRNIREDKGYTYSPSSALMTRRGSGIWAEFADVTTNVTGPSLTEITGEIERLRNEAPSEEELTGVKRNMAGIFAIINASRSGLIGQLQFADEYGLGEAHVRSWVQQIMAVTPEDVKATAQKHLDPAKMSIVVVGSKKEVEAQLGAFKPLVP